MLKNRKESGTPPAITKLIYNSASYTDSKDITHQINPGIHVNIHFINVGSNHSENLPLSDINPAKYINQSFSNRFACMAHEVQETIIKLRPCPHARVCFHLKTHLFLYRYDFRPHVSDEKDQ